MPAGRRRDLAILALFTLLLHAPFLMTPVQGDEVNYLDTAREVFRQPLTPQNFQFVFQGRVVDMAGHPHPPLNAYLVAIPWMLAGQFSVFWFHAYYLLFALAISFAAYALAAQFTTQPLWAALLMAASPIVQVNLNTVASPEPPTLAFVLIGAAAFMARRFAVSGIALSLAGLTALQALALPPILLLSYVIKRERPEQSAWLALAAPYAALGGWQALQFALIHRLPFGVLFGYVREPGLSGPGIKASSALALLQHLGVLVTLIPVARWRLWAVIPGVLACLLATSYPWWERALLLVFMTLGVNALLWLWSARKTNPFLAGWALLYFAFAAVVFFAGASRYLLPLAAPVVLLFVMQYGNRTRWLRAALAFNVILGLNIAFAAHEFARVYAGVEPPPGRNFLVNGEWGFRYYMLQRGGRMLETYSVHAPGEWIVASELSLAGKYDSLAEETAVEMKTEDLRVRTPLRLIDRYAHSGFSSAAAGLLPFSFSNRPLDRITYSRTSPFLNTPGDWTPTQFSGRLVYLPAPGAPVRLLLDSALLRFALFAQGQGQATFRISAADGARFEKTVQVSGELWEENSLALDGVSEVVLSVDAPPTLRAGWGELITYPDAKSATDAGAAGSEERIAPRPYLHLGDVRCRPQLLRGWYGIEDGGWRWMAREAEVALPAPAGGAARFEMQLYFPPGHLERAGGPVTVNVALDGEPLAEQTYAQPGGYLLSQPVQTGLLTPGEHRIRVRLSRAAPPAGGDQRELGAVVQGLGFVQ